MKRTQKRISLHRFHDLVAFSTDETQTLYLTPEMARCFADRLQEFADDINECGFTDSLMPTADITDESR